MDFMPWAGLILLAYLLGSIPFGLVLTGLFADIDIRKAGSGNIGATNVRRLAGNTLGLLTLVGDVAKGAVPVVLAKSLSAPGPLSHNLCLSLVVLAAFCGHLFPVYMKMKGGGKGVATAAGCLAAISPLTVVVALGVFLLAAFGSNRVSVGSLAASAVLPPAIWWDTGSTVFAACALALAIGIFLRHSANIKRLFNGSEPTIRAKPSSR